MTIEIFLRQTTSKLEHAGIETARLDALVILEDALGINRAHILAHPEKVISPAVTAKLNTKVTQRTKHVPLAYIRGRKQFYGRDFTINNRVLIPRAESEAIIELLKKVVHPPDNPRIADIGTGSGCLGITAALEFPAASVELYDIDQNALTVARGNAGKLAAKVTVQKADLLQKLSVSEQYEAVISNLPYVPDRYIINRAAAHEPRRAIFAGENGMELYRHFWEQIKALPRPPAHVITESLPFQHTANNLLAQKAGYHHIDTLGLAQRFTPKP
jgi:release factor glutamine methyltransferase